METVVRIAVFINAVRACRLVHASHVYHASMENARVADCTINMVAIMDITVAVTRTRIRIPIIRIILAINMIHCAIAAAFN